MSYYGGVHTQIGVYRRRNDSRHAIDLHAMSWIVTASLAWLAAGLGCPPVPEEEVVCGEEELG